jgi:hypothetical protein
MYEIFPTYVKNYGELIRNYGDVMRDEKINK